MSATIRSISWSPSVRLTDSTKGLDAPAVGSSEPAVHLGANPRWAQPWSMTNWLAGDAVCPA
jgi:hypothetical protein